MTDTQLREPMAGEAVSADDVRRAAERMAGVAVRTPLLEAPLLNRAAGRRILVKAECLQLTGSFKFRGAWSHLSLLNEAGRAPGRVLAYSSGNHAQGVALAAQKLGVAATIVMPQDAPALKQANTRAYGADLVFYDRAGGASREAVASSIAQTLDADETPHLIKPFDDPFVIAGQGVVGLEIAEDAAKAGAAAAEIAVCCGGGGLSSGVALAVEETKHRVRPVEPLGFDDWARSLAVGAPQSNDAPTGSICDAILTPAPGALTWPIGRRLFGPGVVVSDVEARLAMAAAARHLKLVLEPGGAVALAAALYHPDAFAGDALVVVASGGNVDLENHARWTRVVEWSESGLPTLLAADP